MKGILAKATASPRASKLTSIQGAKEYTAGSAPDVAGIKVVDPKTLVVTLATPDASFLINMRFVSPVPKKLLDGKDSQAKDAFFQKPVGAGPFTFVSWNVGGDFVAQRNPNYYQKGLPYLDKFTHRTIPDAQSLVNSLLSGDIDASNYPSPAGADKLKANKDLNVLVPPFSSPDGWTFNLKNPWLAKKEVRQAVAYCMDMEQFSKDSLYGLGKPGNGPIAPGNALYDPILKPYTYDLDKAKALIKRRARRRAISPSSSTRGTYCARTSSPSRRRNSRRRGGTSKRTRSSTRSRPINCRRRTSMSSARA